MANRAVDGNGVGRHRGKGPGVKALRWAMVGLAALLCNPAPAPAEEHGDASVTTPRFLPPATGPAEPVRPASIRFVTSDDFPPFNFIDGGGRLTGFNVELARAVCARLQVPCIMQVRAFPMLVDALNRDEADAIVAGVKDTNGLRRYLAYTLPYLRLPARFVARRDSGIDPLPETLAGRVVGVVGGTAYDRYLADFFPAATRRQTETLEEALGLLAAGGVDVVFGGAVPLVFWLQGPEAGGCCAFAGGAFTEPAYFGEGMTIAVRRDDEALRRAITDALRSLEADGTIADLHLRFFPAGLY